MSERVSANKAPKHHPTRNSFVPCINGIFQYTANYMTHEYATIALLQRPFGSAKAHEPQASGVHLPKACVFCRPKGQQRCFHDVTSVYMHQLMPADASKPGCNMCYSHAVQATNTIVRATLPGQPVSGTTQMPAPKTENSVLN